MRNDIQSRHCSPDKYYQRHNHVIVWTAYIHLAGCSRKIATLQHQELSRLLNIPIYQRPLSDRFHVIATPRNALQYETPDNQTQNKHTRMRASASHNKKQPDMPRHQYKSRKKKSHTSKSSAGVVQLRNRKWTRRFLVAPSTTKVHDPSSVQTPCIPKQAGSLSRPCAFQQPPNIPKPNRVNKNMPYVTCRKTGHVPPKKQ